jgi:hypothetical protein
MVQQFSGGLGVARKRRNFCFQALAAFQFVNLCVDGQLAELSVAGLSH